ncbi:hypothetical protein BCV72DRAFT_180936, partial [Rhizopus microsporus var. microsporus]
WLNSTAAINLIALDPSFTTLKSSPSSAQNAVNVVYGLMYTLYVNLDEYLLKQWVLEIVKLE